MPCKICNYCKQEINYNIQGELGNHVRNCRIKLGLSKTVYDDLKNSYFSNPSHCNFCNEQLEYKQRRNKFCSSACAASFNNHERKRTEESKNKTRETIVKKFGFESIDEWHEQKINKKIAIEERKQKRQENKREKELKKKKIVKRDVKPKVERKIIRFIKPIQSQNLTPDEILRRKKISDGMKRNPNSGGYRPGSGKGKKAWYESVIAGLIHVDSTYELEYAKYLDDNNINWKKNTDRFEYFDENESRIRKYIPDFYLINDDEYIEVKGFVRENDPFKWKCFPKKLKILFRKDLIALGIKVI